MQIDFAVLESTFARLNKSATICAKELELNEVSRIFKSEVDQLFENMETIRPLLDPSMG